MKKPPIGITPPAPGLEREEPDFWVEDDIPSDDHHPAARAERSATRDDRPQVRPERQ
jgi:hypothetical protein